MSELERLRGAWASLAHDEGSVGCASPDQIWEAVAGRLPEEQVRDLLSHSLTCADCSALWRLAREMASAAGETGTLAPQVEPVPFHRRARGLLGAGALAAAAIAALAIVPRLAARQEAPVIRGPEESVLQPDPSTLSLDRNRPILRWSGAPEGSRYAVTVSTPDLTVLVQRNGLLSPELELPEKALLSVAPDSQVVWRVEAILPDGRRITSRAFLSRVK